MGTDIACQIDRDINSQRPGIVKCIVPFPVRGSDKSKSVVLLDRYTEIVGQQRGVVAQGQNRIDFLFTRACTPDNVCVELNSPAGDEMGAAGVPGDVDNHVWSRIGLAMFLSVIEQAPQAAAQAFTGGGGNTFLRFGNGGQSVASQVLQNQINIPPEITRPRGAWITITAARDLYFPMYDVEVKR
jgi:type IV secretion system protein VirB10